MREAELDYVSSMITEDPKTMAEKQQKKYWDMKKEKNRLEKN